MEGTSEQCKISLEINNKIKHKLEWKFGMEVLERQEETMNQDKSGYLLEKQHWEHPLKPVLNIHARGPPGEFSSELESLVTTSPSLFPFYINPSSPLLL